MTERQPIAERMLDFEGESRPATPEELAGIVEERPAGKAFDPRQLRDPHTGEWIDEPGATPDPADASGVDGVAQGQAAVESVVNVDRLGVTQLDPDDMATARFLGDEQKIAISPDSSAKTVANAIAHESGHYVDTVLGNGDYLSQTSDGDPIYQLLKKTSSIQAILNDEVTILKGDDSTRGYMVNGREMFARAFEQYVAVKSQEPLLLDELRFHQGNEHMKFMVWPDDEFEPIVTMFDKLFKDEGLAK
jgi:hypothetical protein